MATRTHLDALGLRPLALPRPLIMERAGALHAIGTSLIGHIACRLGMQAAVACESSSCIAEKDAEPGRCTLFGPVHSPKGKGQMHGGE